MTDVQPSADDGTRTSAMRLGIGHLLIWSLGTAVIFQSARSLGIWPTTSEAEVTETAFQLAYAMTFGAALGGFLLFLWHGVRHRVALLQHPGHVLALLVACLAILMAVSHSAIGAYMRLSGEQWVSPAWQRSIMHAIVSAAALVGLLVMRFGWKWRALMLLMVLAGVIVTLWEIAMIPSLYDQLNPPNWIFSARRSVYIALLSGGLILIGVVSAWDYLTHGSRDWLHWAGVAVVALAGALDVVAHAYEHYFETLDIWGLY